MMIFGTFVKNDDICSLFFFIVLKFSGFWAVREVKGKRIAQNENSNYIHHVPYLWNMADDYGFWYTCVK